MAPPEFAVGDIQGAINEHCEPEAGAGAELEHADAPLGAVLQGHQPYAGKLRQHAGVSREVATREWPAVKDQPSNNLLAPTRI